MTNNNPNYPGKELESMSFAVNYHQWIVDELEPFIGNAVVEVGAGIKYHLLTRDSVPRAGVVKISRDDVKPNWIPYIAVEDVLQTIAKTEKWGGKLLIKSSEEMRDNPLAIIADPSGAVFGIQQIRDFANEGGNLP